MALFGPDLAGGMRRLYRPSNPAGLWLALLFVVLLVVINQIMQSVFAMGVTAVMFRGGDVNPGDVIKSYMIGIFPASVVTALCAVGFARLKGGQAAAVLSLRRPHFGLLGWPAVLLLFMVAIYAAIVILALALNLDLSQYAPTEGQDNADQIGLVKQAMFDIAHDPKLFLLVLPSVALGAPLAEEFMFRGQLFSALSLSRLGVAGATLITAALWSLLHVTEPWFSVALIFIMGLVFGFLMWRFGSIWVTIACHALWNGAYSLIMFAGVGS